jgi:selenocysteine lyase/cysteine desulfurase
MDLIHTRVSTLVAWLLEELVSLHHGNGAPLVRLFGPSDTQRRGAILALHLLDPAGQPYDVGEMEKAASRAGIATRTGCFCNPGDGEVAHDISREDMELCFGDSRGLTTLIECQRVIEDTTGKVPNTLRVSLGLVSDFADVHRFAAFTKRYLDRPR